MRRPRPARERRPPSLRLRIVPLGAALAALSLSLARPAPPVRFDGLGDITENEARAMIETQLAWIEESGASKALADDAAYFLERAIRRRGYPRAQVTPSLDGGRVLTLSVDKGEHQRIGEIAFRGNEAGVGEPELRALVTRATANRTKGKLAERALPFVRGDIESGIGEVQSLYRSLGYLEATVRLLPNSADERGGAVDLEIEIAPGPRFRIGDVGAGGFDADSASGRELLESLGRFSGMVATTGNVAAARGVVASHFRERGHYKSEIETRPTKHDATVDLFFEVSSGGRFVVRDVRFEGNEQVSPAFLERRFRHLVGQPYDTADVDETYRELLSTGMFETLSIAPEARGDETVDLLVRVGEARTSELGLAAGYGSFEGGIASLSHQQRNLFGLGRQLRTRAELTGRGLAGDITYADRWFFESPLRFEGSLFALRKEFEGYDKFETGLRGEVLWPVGDHFTTGAFAQVGLTDIYESEIDEAFLGDRTYRLSTLGVSASWDTRDSPTNPRTGLQIGTTLEYASALLGSEVDFLRATLRVTKHLPVGEHGQLRLGARSGFIVPSENTGQIPIDSRFFSGGSTSVRGFDERHLGPDDGRGHPVGGEFYTTFNAEYSRPIYGMLRGAVFADAGNLLRDYSAAGLDDMRYAAGLGLRLELPTGPVRIDYGWNLDRHPGEERGALHVSIGLAF